MRSDSKQTTQRKLLKNLTQDYCRENFENQLDRFKQIKNVQNQRKFSDQDWALFSTYALVSRIHKIVDNYTLDVKLYPCDHIRSLEIEKKVFEDKDLKFLMHVLENSDSFHQINKVIKDRKTSFFRLLNRHLKKNSKHEDTKDRKILETMQQSLNKNTISGKLIEDFFEAWKEQILTYLKGENLMKDILFVNKSKSSRYFYILYRDQIIDYAQKKKFSIFPFYQKTSLTQAIKRLIKTLCNQSIKTIPAQINSIEKQQYSSGYTGGSEYSLEKQEDQIKLFDIFQEFDIEINEPYHFQSCNQMQMLSLYRDEHDIIGYLDNYPISKHSPDIEY